MGTYAIILAAGSGRRMGLTQNKVRLPLNGVPALILSVKAFRGLVTGQVLVARPGEEADLKSLLMENGLLDAVTAVVPGGWDRQASVLAGLMALPKDAETVLVHDGARALVTEEIILRVMDSVRLYGSGVAAVPLKDTVKQVDSRQRVLCTPDRASLMSVQTPQGFSYELLMKAHLKAGETGLRATDDAGLVEAMGVPVRLVMGSYENIKLTTPEDMIVMESLLARREGPAYPPIRAGHGYDVHRLAPGRRLILCGVEIPHETGLLGHSDADVALHALMDALLGAASLGDIGRHFPDNDPAYKGISSLALTSRVLLLLAERRLRPASADITIAAQRPKLAPYLNQMQSNVADALGLPLDRVNVKATTTEGLGFEGEEKGISAQAVCLAAPI